ncbi:MAG: PAQR family membrane homeostasis protein TrhA [Fusobacteriaceae bacterium]
MDTYYSRKEEWISAMTHFLGVALGLIGLGALLVHSLHIGHTGYLIGNIVFTISIILLYSMSGTYHILKNEKAKKIFKILDHSAIYVLISGTYTPYLLGVLEGEKKWILFSLQWGLTFLGIIFKIFYTGKFNKVSTLIYLIMGWMIIFVYNDLKMLTNALSVHFLLAGGITYTVGVIFYLLKDVKYSHAVWHLFVLGGTIFIYVSVYLLK